MGLRANVMETELGRERRCTKCRDYWPEDQEFWFFRTDSRRNKQYISQPCKACCYEYPSWQAKAGKPKGEKENEIFAAFIKRFPGRLSAG